MEEKAPALTVRAGGGPRIRWKQVVLFLGVIGPGIITANVDNDAGGITTYSLAGAHFGTQLLWTLIPITVALVVVQEMAARMGAVTGKGLADLIRENFGVKLTFYLMLALLASNYGNTVSEFAGVAASMELFGVPKFVSVPLAAAAIWLLVVQGTYRLVERVFLVACVFYFVYPVSAFLAHPDWKVVLRDTVIPSRISLDSGYVAMLVGLVGTTIAPWMQFYLQSSVVEKGIRKDRYWMTRWDVVVGCVVTDVVAFFIIVACAATLFVRGVAIESAADAARSLEPLAGRYASQLFAFGLLNASVFSAAILPLSTVYYVCEAFGWEAGVDKKFGQARAFYGIYTAMIAMGAAVVLWPGFPLIRVMFWSQVANGIALPLVLVFMLLLVNREELMGDQVNGRGFNAVAWVTTVTMIALTLLLVANGFGLKLGTS
ncbi:MAG TPA: Nramp family divalent metal transporter [Thermoanaerobaculia bacterium]|nr:Nramp family divalent metal transporter [Thermoanaerobaculia bacterium]